MTKRRQHKAPPAKAPSAYRYGGENIAKKLARLTFWERAKGWRGADFYSDDHLVLASPEGGDVSVLLGLGVSPAHIWAVDIDAAAADACARKFPGVNVRHGDVGALAKKWGRRFGVIFLDFCGWGNAAELEALAVVACHATRHEGILAYAFQRGREPTRVTDTIAAHRERLLESVGRQTGLPSLYAEQRAIAEQLGVRRWTNDGRSKRIYDALFDRMLPFRKLPNSLCNIRYHSSCAWKRGGVPMEISAKWIYAEPRGVPVERFRERWQQLSQAAMHAMIQADTQTIATDEWANAPGRLPCAKVQICGRIWTGPQGQMFDRELTSILWLLRFADLLEPEFPGRVPQLLNIRPARLAAFRAHRSMGTYEKESHA